MSCSSVGAGLLALQRFMQNTPRDYRVPKGATCGKVGHLKGNILSGGRKKQNNRTKNFHLKFSRILFQTDIIAVNFK